jgi:hypothetical protein
MQKELSDKEIEEKIKKSIKKLSFFYDIYCIFNSFKNKFRKINKFFKKNMWPIFIIYTFLLIYLLKI